MHVIVVHGTHVAKKAKGGRPKKSRGNRGRPKDILCLSLSKPVHKAVQQCISHGLSVKHGMAE